MRKTSQIIAGSILAVISVIAGYMQSPEDIKKPVLLSNGEVITQPCYVTVDGECVALVDSEKTAKKVMKQIKEEYKNEKTTDIRICEETSTADMELENGDEKPDVLTEEEAAEQLVEEKIITVETKEKIVEGVTVEPDTVIGETEEMNLGESRVIQQGKNGFALVTKEITKENGKKIDETLIEERTLTEAVPEIILQGTAGLAEPLDYMRITSEFGQRWGKQHTGLDLGIAEGTSIYASRNGTVVYSGYCGSYGNLVRIDHGGGLETYYAHCSKLIVTEGQQVETGQVIAEVGSTGNSTGPHLHFEVRVNGQAQNPLSWLP